jgi:formate dehydrogenase
MMEDSGLRGLGGAGFPAGRKWKIVAAEPAPRLLAINIDEGEPGTFKDRYYLERDPHRLLEGAIVAAWAVGIDRVYIYLRDEYHGCRAILQRELAALGADPPCRIPEFHLRRGAGAYICGEESAMIESIEGKRGEPRLRPPYVAQVGCSDVPRSSTTWKRSTGCAISSKRAPPGSPHTAGTVARDCARSR